MESLSDEQPLEFMETICDVELHYLRTARGPQILMRCIRTHLDENTLVECLNIRTDLYKDHNGAEKLRLTAHYRTIPHMRWCLKLPPPQEVYDAHQLEKEKDDEPA